MFLESLGHRPVPGGDEVVGAESRLRLVITYDREVGPLIYIGFPISILLLVCLSVMLLKAHH